MNAIDQIVDSVNPLLLPDRDEPYRLHDVFERLIYGCRDEIVLSFGGCFLRFKVEPDDDTIRAQYHDKKLGSKRGYRSIGHEKPWRLYLNEDLGWTWLAINQQGYWDSALLSFDSVVPNILLNVMASSMYVFTISPNVDSRPDRKRVKRARANVR